MASACMRQAMRGKVSLEGELLQRDGRMDGMDNFLRGTCGVDDACVLITGKER